MCMNFIHKCVYICVFTWMKIYVRSLIHVYIMQVYVFIPAQCITLLTHIHIHTNTLIHYHSRPCRHEQVQQRSPEVLIESKIGEDSVGSYQYVQASSLEMSSTEPASGTAGKCRTCQLDYTVPMDKDTTTVLCCTSCAYAGNAVSASQDASRSYGAPDGQVHMSLYLHTRTTAYVITCECTHIHVYVHVCEYIYAHACTHTQTGRITHKHQYAADICTFVHASSTSVCPFCSCSIQCRLLVVFVHAQLYSNLRPHTPTLSCTQYR